ncbi:hypothetical protein AMATHDRAFT_7507 [Amanita thiersii Skay4041]|uniref:Actin-like ATPase domain-containing protein n=1 Tax=Amanita thiersii Skay4041 TaxID=703135 RepID=A0A2A9NBJ6_9AGAR|nr:hypothetical protein AMATHDRAFT_7507 [Amanita thiersii Skay4041]
MALLPVVGINLGNSYASIAVFTKEDVAECIANQDGERQIACAIAFHGEEIYIGNQAKPHLVKNSKNTVVGFRNLLGLKYDQLPPSVTNLVPHPDDPSLPAYKVDILQPAPKPISVRSAVNTPQGSAYQSPAQSNVATPLSEPIPATRYLTPLEATSIFLKYLTQSAEEFIGAPLTAAVITVPPFFSPTQRSALLQAARDASIPVLQLFEEAGAASVTTTSPTWSSIPISADRTQLLIDIGHSSTTISLLSLRSGLVHSLGNSTHSFGGSTVDSLLLKHFSSEFTKKTRIPLDPTSPADGRSTTKLLLALAHTKRTISASPSAASLSVESLKDGLDFTSTINRLRFDLLARPFYSSISSAILDLLSSTSPPTDPTSVDEIVYVGGTASLPGLDEHILTSCGFREDIDSPFARGVVVGGGVGDPTTVLARGCALQATLLSDIPTDTEEGRQLLTAFAESSEHAEEQLKQRQAIVTAKTIGLVFPRSFDAVAAPNGDAANGNGDAIGVVEVGVDELTKSAGGIYVPLLTKETPLPARRSVEFVLTMPSVNPDAEAMMVLMEIWEVTEAIKVEKRKPPKEIYTDDEDADTVKDGEGKKDTDEVDEDDEEDEIEVKHPVIEKNALIGVLEVPIKLKPVRKEADVKSKKKSKKESKPLPTPSATIEVRAVRDAKGGLVVEAGQVVQGKSMDEGGSGKVVLQVAST